MNACVGRWLRAVVWRRETGRRRGAELAVSRAIRVFSKKLLRRGGVLFGFAVGRGRTTEFRLKTPEWRVGRGGVHFGGVWGALGPDDWVPVSAGMVGLGRGHAGSGVALETVVPGVRCPWIRPGSPRPEGRAWLWIRPGSFDELRAGPFDELRADAPRTRVWDWSV